MNFVLCPKSNVLPFNLDFINTCFSKNTLALDEMLFYIDNPFVFISCDRWRKI